MLKSAHIANQTPYPPSNKIIPYSKKKSLRGISARDIVLMEEGENKPEQEACDVRPCTYDDDSKI